MRRVFDPIETQALETEPSYALPALRPSPDLAVIPQILIVADDPALQADMVEYLERHHMQVGVVAARAGLTQRLNGRPSLVVLDLDLRWDDGLALVRTVRSASDVPLIVVSAERREEADRVIALELGADDYLVKPLGLRELLARMRSLLRRRAGTNHAIRRGARVRFGPWELDSSHRRIQRPGEAPVPLTKSEYALLHAFLQAPRRPLTREHLLHATRVHEDVLDRSVDVQVLRLRRKLEPSPAAPRVIETVRGLGYVFLAEVEVN